MKTPTPPFYNAQDELLYSILTGGDCIGYEQIALYDTEIVSLAPPLETLYALVVIEADPATGDKTRIARFIEAGNITPTAEKGIPLGDLSVYEIKGKNNLANWRITGIEAGMTHQLRIQYFA